MEKILSERSPEVTNIYGQKLDKNGYAPSILPSEGCIVCGKGGDLARHEVFFGPYRRKSKEMGLWVTVCPECHRAIHEQEGGIDQNLKEIAQERAMEYHGWTTDEFRKQFGKNWL